MWKSRKKEDQKRDVKKKIKLNFEMLKTFLPLQPANGVARRRMGAGKKEKKNKSFFL